MAAATIMAKVRATTVFVSTSVMVTISPVEIDGFNDGDDGGGGDCYEIVNRRRYWW